jgi:hypothetical protein
MRFLILRHFQGSPLNSKFYYLCVKEQLVKRIKKISCALIYLMKAIKWVSKHYV